MEEARFLSGYYAGIKDPLSQKRYMEKLKDVRNIDPYEVKKSEWKDDMELWPAVTHVHVCMYLILTPSPYTDKDMLNYKSLDCYVNFTKGWVRTVVVKDVDTKRIVIGKVNHSQRMNDKPLTPWFIATKEGQILSGHCDCMAGMGETCSHIASLLWVVASGVQQRESLTCTDKSAYWVIPSPVKSIPYAEIEDIAFTGKKKKQKQHHAISEITGSHEVQTPMQPPALAAAGNSSKVNKKKFKPTEEEKSAFFSQLATLAPHAKPAILAIVPSFCSAYVPASLNSDLPASLSDLYDRSNLELGYYELLQKSMNTSVSVSVDEAKVVELRTREQANSRLWFRMRTGRVTASKFKAVCHTDPASPSRSLVISICHPDSFRFSTQATAWGCKHEKTALAQYKNISVRQHTKHSVRECGFYISVEHPFIGASPDGVVDCQCCGWGIIEIKCPYCHRDDGIDSACHDKGFCLERPDDQSIPSLKKNHSYYYQVQAQLYCTKASYCDFVVFTEKEIHIERITANHNFLLLNIEKAKHFFQAAVLPELLGRWFSRPPIALEEQDATSTGTFHTFPSSPTLPAIGTCPTSPTVEATTHPTSLTDIDGATCFASSPTLVATCPISHTDACTICPTSPTAGTICPISSLIMTDDSTTYPTSPTAIAQPMSPTATSPTSCPSSVPQMRYCYCQKAEVDDMLSSDMVGCDNEKCKYQWFHLKCLDLKAFPCGSKWFCPDCRPTISRRKRH